MDGLEGLEAVEDAGLDGLEPAASEPVFDGSNLYETDVKTDSNFLTRLGNFAKAFAVSPASMGVGAGEAAAKSQQAKGFAQGVVGMGKSTAGLAVIAGDNLQESPESVLTNPFSALASKIFVSESRKQELKDMGYDDKVLGQIQKFGERVTEFGENGRRFFEDLQQSEAIKLDPKIFEGEFTDNPSWTRATTVIAQAVPSLAAAFAVSVSTGNPLLGAAYLGLIDSESTYDLARQKGVPQAKRNALFAANTIGSTALEYLPLKGMMKGLTRSRIGNIVAGSLMEGGQEGAQQLWQNLIVKYGIDDARDLFEGIVESVIAGAGSGAVISSMSPVKKDLAKKFTPDEVEAAIGTVADGVLNKAETIDNEIMAGIQNSNEVLDKQSESIDINAEKELLQKSIVEEAKSFKTVDEFVKSRGEALYHGTSEQIEELKPSSPKNARGNMEGIYLTPDKDTASEYGKNVIEVYADLKNPFVGDPRAYVAKKYNVETPTFGSDKSVFERYDHYVNPESIKKELIKDGFDGVIQDTMRGKEIIAFDSKSVKTRKQLESAFEKAQSETSDQKLIDEAVKFDKVSDFIDSQMSTKNGIRIVSSAIRTSNGKTFEGQTHSEAYKNAVDSGEIVERGEKRFDKDGNEIEIDFDLFKLSNGDVIDRLTADKFFGTPASETIRDRKKYLKSIFDKSRDQYLKNNAERDAKIKKKAADKKENITPVDYALEPMVSTLARIDQSLADKMRKYEYNLLKKSIKYQTAIKPVLAGISGMDKSDFSVLDLALKNGDVKIRDQVLKKHGLEKDFESVRETLDELYEEAEKVGLNVRYKRDYFPRLVKDADGLLDYFAKLLGKDYSTLTDAFEAKAEEIGRPLTNEEKAAVINTMLRGYAVSQITLSKPGQLKQRQIEEVTEALNKFYAKPQDALARYIASVSEAIEARKFFGKTDKEPMILDDSIGAMTLELLQEGRLKPSQEKELSDLLKARFNSVGMNPIMGMARNIAYIMTMNSPMSAVTQIGDLAFSFYNNGYYNTARSLFDKSAKKVDWKTIGGDRIIEEYTDTGKVQQFLNNLFKIIGLQYMDRLGKNAFINSALIKFQEAARSGDKEFAGRMNEIFGNTQVIEDLKSDKITDDVKFLLFNEISNFQPVTQSEMPRAYLENQNSWRMLYMLKSYTVKQLDSFRREAFSKILTGEPEQVKEGLTNLVKLAAALMLTGAGADTIKNLILGRDFSISDLVVDNILKLVGFSKYTVYEFKREGIGSAALSVVLPPHFSIGDKLIKDFKSVFSGKKDVDETYAVNYIPVGGKLYYWWFGGGADQKKKS